MFAVGRRPQGFLDRALVRRHGQRRAARHRQRVLARRLLEHRGRHDAVHEPDVQRLGRRERARREEDVRRMRGADDVDQALDALERIRRARGASPGPRSARRRTRSGDRRPARRRRRRRNRSRGSSRSPAAASPSTPPTRGPTARRTWRSAAASARIDRNSLMSAPLMNACSPAPRRMITRMSPSRASDSIAAASPSQTAALRALRACWSVHHHPGERRLTRHDQGFGVGGHALTTRPFRRPRSTVASRPPLASVACIGFVPLRDRRSSRRRIGGRLDAMGRRKRTGRSRRARRPRASTISRSVN